MRVIPLHNAFPDGASQMVRELLPTLVVDADAVANQPTWTDPLGGKPQLVVYHRVDLAQATTMLRFDVLGDTSMPWLDYTAAGAYLCVNWPEIFSMRGGR